MSNYICSLSYTKNAKTSSEESLQYPDHIINKLKENLQKKLFLCAEIKPRDDYDDDEEKEYLRSKGWNVDVMSVYCTSDDPKIEDKLSSFVRGYCSCLFDHGILTKEG